MELIIRNARLRRVDGKRDIGIEDGRIVAISEKITEGAEQFIEADGRLVTEPFVNLHAHLDKCLTGEWIRTATGAKAGSLDVIPAASLIKKRFTEEDIQQRASKALEASISYGCTSIRAFADVDSIGGLTAVKALLKVKKSFSGIADIQVVAFPQEGILRDRETEELLYKGMECGADIVGGIPWYEFSDEESRRHTDIVFEVAKNFNKDVHTLIDDTEDTDARNIQYLLSKTLKEKYIGRVSASHCRGALDSPNEAYAKRIVNMAKEAQATIVENPHISLMMYGRNDKAPVRRGITRVREFLAAGVNVAIGQDDIDDPYYPFGRGNMLELAYFMCHAAYLDSPAQFESAYDMVTLNGARAMRLENSGIKIGSNADLIVLDAQSVHEALRMQAERLFVIKKGKIVAENRVARKLNFLQAS